MFIEVPRGVSSFTRSIALCIDFDEIAIVAAMIVIPRNFTNSLRATLLFS
jgi:hypothetical protein